MSRGLHVELAQLWKFRAHLIVLADVEVPRTVMLKLLKKATTGRVRSLVGPFYAFITNKRCSCAGTAILPPSSHFRRVNMLSHNGSRADR